MSGLPIDPDTRILTRGGWRSYQDYIDGLLRVGEDIYTYEPCSKTFKWEPLVSVILHGNGALVSITLENTVMNNPTISLIMGEKVPWIIEVVKRESRRMTGYDGIKLKEIDKTRTGIGEVKKSYDIGTTYYLILGEVDNLVTHQENDNRVDMTNVIVEGGGSGLTWTPYNTNETVVVLQKGLVFCVGTLSLRDGLGTYTIPIGNINTLPIALNGYVLVESKAVQLKVFSGFSPLVGGKIVNIIISSIPAANEGTLYKNNIPITNLDLPLSLTIEEANNLIYIPYKLFLGISSITYQVIDNFSNTSANTANLNITVVNNEATQLATELTLQDVKTLIEDLPNQTFNTSTNITNFPSDYSKELTLENINTKLDTLINALSQSITSEWLSITSDTTISAGSSYIYIYIKQGSASINGISKVAGEYINLEPSPFARHPAVIITTIPGAIVEVVRGY